jgi:glycosidase
MKKLILSTCCLLAFVLLKAQISLSPEKPGFTETVTLSFDATQGNAGLANCNCDIYAHTGLITNQSQHPGDWKNVVADWGVNLPKLKLAKTGDNRYQLKFKISELYGIPPAGDVTALAFVFRNADGSKTGKATGNQDIYLYFKAPNFKTPPTTLKVSQSPAPEWAKTATIYEVNLRQYTPEGTFQAFAKHLPRLRDMGIDILWFMPIQPIGLKERKGTLGSYYSIQDYKAVNPEFGTLDDFKRLVDLCHGLGFHVVLDWVANHSSHDAVWTSTHPEWYNRDDQGRIISPYDWTDVADLNYDNYHLRQAMKDAMLFWVKEADIDGFRCDVAGEVPLDFWEDARHSLEQVKPIWMIAENADQLYLMNHAFNANYGWPFHHLMNEIAKGHQKASAVFDLLDNIENSYPKGSYPMNFITNHDENSWQGTEYERLGDGHQAFAVLTFTVPGMPLIYSGQEAANKKRLQFFEKDPLDWSDASLIPFYSHLDYLKSANPALWNGNSGGPVLKISHDKPDKVVAFSREKSWNKVITIINLSGEAQTVNLDLSGQEGIYVDYFEGGTVEAGQKMKLDLGKWGWKVWVKK